MLLMKSYPFFCLFTMAIAIMMGNCQQKRTTFQEIKTTKNTDLYQEPHRTQFHFSPPGHWMNDPNGMVYYQGEYHLFYKYFPDSTVWGPMHWGTQ